MPEPPRIARRFMGAPPRRAPKHRDAPYRSSPSTDAGAPGLRGVLKAIDGGPFQAYRRILGEHDLGEFTLTVVSVPSDALAGPARLRLSIDRGRAGLGGSWSHGDDARLILEDAIIRAATEAVDDLSGPPVAAAPGSGRLWVAAPGPGLVDRTTADVGSGAISISLALDLPAVARRVLGEQAVSILFDRLPRIGMAALLFPQRRINDLKPRIEAQARRNAVIASLASRGLAAVIPSAALPNKSIPSGTRVTLETRHGSVTGLGLPAGVTLLVGASISGAGAWLKTLATESGAAPGGRAMFVGPAVSIGASRRTFGPIDLSAFVRACTEIPRPENVMQDDAPAPLAVAASVVEAYEAGARVLLLDEDGLPAGALAADGRIQRLLGASPSPAVPLIDRLADLSERWGLSIIIAARALGDLCEVSDTVLVLRNDGFEDATDASRRVVRATASFRSAPSLPACSPPRAREVRVRTEGNTGALRAGVWGARGVRLGDDLVDLSDTSLVNDVGRLRSIAVLLKCGVKMAANWRPVGDLLDDLVSASAREALAGLEEPGLCDLARPSRLEIAAALARWKRVEFRLSPVTLSPSAR